MRIILRCLLDPQGLDGGGLLTHEEAQPLETGLMNTHTIYPSIRLYHEAEG